MNEKTFAAISLSNRDFDSFEAKQAEAVRWIELAAAQGADLAVLPEGINIYCGDGPDNPRALPLREVAFDDWQTRTRPLFDVAARCKIAVTIPLFIREANALTNCFFLVDKTGQLIGRYQKMRLTGAELDAACLPGNADQPLIEWEGLKLGGAICFDTNFLSVFDSQARRGAQAFVVCSLWPGGSQLNYYALQYSTPIALAYPAWSRIIDLDGMELAQGGYRSETLRFGFGSPVVLARINFDRVVLHADFNQQKMLDVQRKYGRRVSVCFDQQNCLFFLESRCRELDINQVVHEFALIPRRQYLESAERRCEVVVNH